MKFIDFVLKLALGSKSESAIIYFVEVLHYLRLVVTDRAHISVPMIGPGPILFITLRCATPSANQSCATFRRNRPSEFSDKDDTPVPRFQHVTRVRKAHEYWRVNLPQYRKPFPVRGGRRE